MVNGSVPERSLMEFAQEQGEPLCAETSDVFPEGFGIRIPIDPSSCVQSLIRRSSEEVHALLKRFGLIVFPETTCFPVVRPFQPASSFQPFHVDGSHALLSTARSWSVMHLMLHPHARGNNSDPTHFVEADEYADHLHTEMERSPRRQGSSSELYLDQIFDRYKVASLQDRAVLREQYRRSFTQARLKYTHPWSEMPDSSLVFSAHPAPEAKRVYHARLQAGPVSNAFVPRLNIYPLDREFFCS